MIIKLVLLSIIFLTIAAAGFGIRMLMKSSARFPETHVSKNPEMQRRGIGCAQDTNIGCSVSEGGCSSCGRTF